MPQASQCLFLRLYHRSGPWFRQATLEYPEVGDTEMAVRSLAEAGLLRGPLTSDCLSLVRVRHLNVPFSNHLAAFS